LRINGTKYGSVGWYSGLSGGRLTASRLFTLIKWAFYGPLA
jgi:hypothetical protein